MPVKAYFCQALALVEGFTHNTRRLHLWCGCFGGPGGPLAMIDGELRQARKGATVTVDSCAEVWLSGSPPFLFYCIESPRVLSLSPAGVSLSSFSF